MAWVRPRTAIAALGIVAALIGGAAYAVVRSQDEARAGLRQELAHRATLAGRFTTGALLNGSDRAQAKAYMGGPDHGIQAAIEAFQGPDPLPRVLVLDARGRVLGADPPSVRRDRQLLAHHPDLAMALRGRNVVSDVFTAPNGQRVFETAVRYRTRHGRRVYAGAAPVELLQTAIGGYLPTAPAVRGGRAYVLDAKSQVLAATGGAELGRTLADRALLAALRGGTSGTYGDRFFVSMPAGSTTWRVLFSVPTDALYEPVNGSTRRAAWALFAAFVLALIFLLAVGATALYRSARLAEERLHDTLTGLPTRALFLDRVDRALAGVPRRRLHTAVLFIDLDRFKRVNDTLGHAAGDALLIEVGRRLREVIRWMDSVSRFGGDEFLVLCEELHDEREALEIASRIQETLSRPIELGARAVAIDCSIGIAMHGPDDAPISAAQLVHDGDIAMYRAKRRGRARVELFEPGLQDEAAVLELDTEAALRAAVAAGGLRVHYQPIVAPPDGALRGVEALVRWQRPGHGLVEPDDLIPLAESTGVIGLVGEWVLRAAIGEVTEWAREGLVDDDFVLAVNVSTRQLSDPALPEVVAAALVDWELPPSALCLAIPPESVVADDPVAAEAMLARLRALGVRLAIDGVGVGDSLGPPLEGARLRTEILATGRAARTGPRT